MSGKNATLHVILQTIKRLFKAQKLKQSADLYAQIYEDDEDLQALTKTAISGWPE